MSEERPVDSEGLRKFINHVYAQIVDERGDGGLETIEWSDWKNGHDSCQYRDLLPLVELYTHTKIRENYELKSRLQAMVEWVKTLDLDPTTKTPICVCGLVMPAECLEPENRDKFIEWAEYHYQHQLQRDEEIAKAANG
jgi:hypothetical protein